jgi:hypothetical protein
MLVANVPKVFMSLRLFDPLLLSREPRVRLAIVLLVRPV